MIELPRQLSARFTTAKVAHLDRIGTQIELGGADDPHDVLLQSELNVVSERGLDVLGSDWDDCESGVKERLE